MPTIYLNQKLDPVGPAYRQWESTGAPDPTGASYVGPPAFGTLVGDLLVVSSRETGGGGVTDHGALTGLLDDDHVGYMRLTGRSGGQTLVGGDSSTDDLVLQASSHPTPLGRVRVATGVEFQADEMITGDLVMRSEERKVSLRFIEHPDLHVEVLDETTGARGRLVIEPIEEETE